MPAKAYIHIGTTKTGTTSIQRSMLRESARLRRDYSLNYPGTTANHMPMALPFLGDQHFTPIENHVLRGRSTREKLLAAGDRLLQSLTRDASRYQTHVMSSEQLHDLDEASLGRLKAFFEGLNLPVSIVVYVRHPAERVSSYISQKVRSGRYSLRTVPMNDNVTPFLKTYAKVFGKENIIIRRFGPQYWQNGRLIDDFTATVHGAPIEGMKELRANESLSAPAVLIADRLFDIAPLKSGKRAHEAWMYRIAGPKFLAPRAVVEQAVAAYRGLLEYLDAEFDIRFHDVDLSKFPEKLSTEFSPETLASLAELLNEQSKALATTGPAGKLESGAGLLTPLPWRASLS